MNKIKSILIMSILLASIFMVLSPVSAATYHVYESDGWQVLHDTIQNAPSGSTIYVHAGIYYIEDTINIESDKYNITVLGDSPLNTIIDATSAEGYGIYGEDYITIKNITVRDADETGICVYDYCTIENCIAYGNEYDGIHVDDYSTIKNCLTYDNGSDGLDADDDCEIINCTSANNGSDGIEIEDDCNIYNCIFFNNDDDGLEVDSEGIYIYNSNSWDNGDENWAYLITDDVYLINCISVDPKFVDGIDTFYLSPSSPCVDKGSTSSAALGLYQGFTTRTDGIWDKGTVDMGFHYASNRGPPSSLPMDKILKIIKENKE
jgi:parallel beta-helix repeat protein